MALRADLGNTVKGIGDRISTFINTAKNTVETTIGTVTSHVGSIWSGGFSGMSEAGKEDLKTAMQQYINTVNDIINGFNAEGQIDNALKGTELETGVHEFLNSMKKLFTAYVEALKLEQDELEEAYNTWVNKNQGSLVTQIQSDKQEIEKAAANVELE